MSCRRAFDVDLADFVASSARPEWAEFRAHYARCAECSAEVRAWTELHLLLQPPAAHPAEELLLRFETERDRQPAAERRAVEEHLARCPSCKDELAALRRFDFASLEARAAASPAVSFAAFLRRLVLHPAFAYAIVLLLLYPALEGRFPSPARHAAREDGKPAIEPLADKNAPAGEVSPKPAEPAAPANGARSEERRFMRARKEAEAPALRESGRAGGERDVEATADAYSVAQEKAERLYGKLDAAAEPAGWKTLALCRARAPIDVAARELGAGLVLTVPVPEAARSGTIEVRVLAADGAREMRERFAGAAERVAMRLPAVWLAPGTYTAGLWRLDATPSAADTFTFRVVP